MPGSSNQATHRRTLAVKHLDGEPLTRADLQYDLLHHIFTDTQAVFTDPHRTMNDNPPGTRVTFRDLYINSLLHSPRCSKASRDKIMESPDFGVEFAKMSLLSNVGRINTTMAFFPEMRTALRTYHPVPSLQKTNGNLQDAPRIKNILKSCYLDNEAQGIILSPSDVLSRSRSGQVPPTTIVNIIFTFSTHSSFIARTHFGTHSSFDFLDFFTPIPVSSKSRARAFLWLCYHYHEAPSYNPFSDDHANAHPGQIPSLLELSPEQAAQENTDPPDEREWGDRMTRQRKEFMENKIKEEEQGAFQETENSKARSSSARGKVRGRVGRTKNMLRTSQLEHKDSLEDREPSPTESLVPILEREASSGLSTRTHAFMMHPEPVPSSSQSRHDYLDEGQLHHHIPSTHINSSANHGPSYLVEQFYDQYDSSLRPRYSRSSPPPLLPSIPDILSDSRTSTDPYPRRHSSSVLEQSSHGQPIRTRPRKAREISGSHPVPISTYPPYIHPSRLRATLPALDYSVPSSHLAPAPVPKRSMLEQAWHVVMTTDPLEDSEEEDGDESMRLDYILRLRIISRLRGKEPTPEPEPMHQFIPIQLEDVVQPSKT